jgi:hypothetical protein
MDFGVAGKSPATPDFDFILSIDEPKMKIHIIYWSQYYP